MMTTRQLQDEILRLKKEKDICILAHAYQSHEILEVADYTGDSYGLSQQAAKAPQKNVLMCGVRFMAETVKILSPEKKVYLSNSGAGCPMAEQLDVEMLSALKESIDYIAGRAEIEVSGNVTKENIARLTGLGVNYVSSGALTHSAPIMDLSMKNLHPVE